MEAWHPISEITRATSKYVAVASPGGIFVQESRAVKKVGRLCWAYFYELPEPSPFEAYILSGDEYEVRKTEGEENE